LVIRAATLVLGLTVAEVKPLGLLSRIVDDLLIPVSTLGFGTSGLKFTLKVSLVLSYAGITFSSSSTTTSFFGITRLMGAFIE
jgi:hypothetical protein